MKTNYKLICMFVLFYILSVSAAKSSNKCSARLREKQLDQIKKKNIEDVVVRGKLFYGYKEGTNQINSFKVEEVWPSQNGSLELGQSIYVHGLDKFESCGSKLRYKRSYLLILNENLNYFDDERHFDAIIEVTPGTSARHHRAIFHQLCGDHKTKSCQTRVLLPSKRSFYYNQMQVIACHVQSLSNIKNLQVNWLLGDKVIDTASQTLYVEEGESGSKGLVITQGTVVDEGVYTCRVSDKMNRILNEAKIDVEFLSVNFKECSADFCYNNGKCIFDLRLNTSYCSCDVGFTGSTCSQREFLPTVGVHKDQMQQLSALIIILCFVTVVAIVMTSCNSFRINKQLKKIQEEKQSLLKKRRSRLYTSVPVIPSDRTGSLEDRIFASIK